MPRKMLAAGIMVAGLCVCTAILRPARVARADEAKMPAKLEPWKAEDIIYAENAGQFRISPDGKWLVWVKSAGDKEKDADYSNLFLSSLTESREIQLTRGTDENGQPRWSPDGEVIAFSSSRARPKARPDTAPAQIWLINAHGGEPWPLTELARPPRHFEWLDKDTLIYSAQEDPALYEQELKKKKDDSEVVDDEQHEPPVRFYKIAINDKKVTRLTTNMDWIDGWSVSRDGKYAVAEHAKSLHYVFDQKVPPVVFLHNLGDGSEKRIFTEGRIRPSDFEWAPDSSGFYAAAPYSTDPRFLTATIRLLYHYDLASGKITQVNLDWENGLGFELRAIPSGFVAQLAAGSRFEVARYTAEKGAAGLSWKRKSLEGEHAKNLSGFALSEDAKTIVYEYSTASKLPQVYRAQLDGSKIISPVQLTKLNEGLVNGRAFAKSEVIRWKGSNDEEVEGLLYYPANYVAGKKYPLITAIHGGPQGADLDLWDDNWAYPINLLAQRGAFILRPNYHGSGNYGLKWGESICCGKYYDLETPDINMGVDYLIAQGKVDPDRIATLGWSNGSILSISLITTYPARYKAASVGAGDVEWISDWGNVDFGESFDTYYFGKSPFEDPQLYIRKSPFFKMDKVQAPVLIFHGTADRNVPPAQSWSFFRALQYFGKTAKYVVFPGEPHGPRKLTHQMRKVEDELAWFDKYLYKATAPESEAVKAESPIKDLLRKEFIAKENGFYGVSTPNAKDKSQKALIPETVARGELKIGRFEVTRAQFATFRLLQSPERNGISPLLKNELASSAGNLPASGVSLGDAKAYVKWLSAWTSETWRLPNEEEMKDLYENREGENTLDYWAGYAPNPEDAAQLRKRTQGLADLTPLLKEVGSFGGQGKDNEEPIYDLGGNVAEWALTADGKGKVMGGSADCPASPKSNCTAAPEYTGFRVVRGAAKPSPDK